MVGLITLILVGRPPISEIRVDSPPAGKVILLSVAPTVTKTQGEWHWYVYADRAWGTANNDSYSDSRPVTTGHVIVFDCCLRLEIRPNPDGSMDIKERNWTKRAEMIPGELLSDINKIEAGGSGFELSHVRKAALGKIVETRYQGTHRIALPVDAVLAKCSFPASDFTNVRLMKYGGAHPVNGSSRWVKKPSPHGQPKLTPAEEKLLRSGYQAEYVTGIAQTSVMRLGLSK